VRINGVGMADVVNFDATKNVAQYQVRRPADAERLARSRRGS